MNEFRQNLFGLWINLITVALTLAQYLITQTKGFRRWWIKPHLKNDQRDSFGAMRLFTYIQLQDHEEFYDFFGMTPDQFDELFGIVRHRLRKRSVRRSLDPELRLAAVLNFLCHGDSVKKTSWFFLIGRSTMYKIVPEVCRALFEELRPRYLAFTNVDDWKAISKEFEERWNLPHVLGALDGKHIRIKKPSNSASDFFFFFTKSIQV